MASATVNNRWVTVNGPVKIEYIHITDDTSNDTTLETVIQRPVAAKIECCNDDLTGTADAASITFSGKTLTLRDPSSAREYLITVFGF